MLSWPILWSCLVDIFIMFLAVYPRLHSDVGVVDRGNNPVVGDTGADDGVRASDASDVQHIACWTFEWIVTDRSTPWARTRVQTLECSLMLYTRGMLPRATCSIE